jgi:hypothetical protein
MSDLAHEARLLHESRESAHRAVEVAIKHLNTNRMDRLDRRRVRLGTERFVAKGIPHVLKSPTCATLLHDLLTLAERLL